MEKKKERTMAEAMAAKSVVGASGIACLSTVQRRLRELERSTQTAVWEAEQAQTVEGLDHLGKSVDDVEDALYTLIRKLRGLRSALIAKKIDMLPKPEAEESEE